jgi:hypothetical protein
MHLWRFNWMASILGGKRKNIIISYLIICLNNNGKMIPGNLNPFHRSIKQPGLIYFASSSRAVDRSGKDKTGGSLIFR